MKKYFILLAIIVSWLTVNSFAFAGVANSEHDMFSEGKGTDPNVCGYCHVPHNATGDKIWSGWGNEAQLTSGPSSAIGNMCYTCHDNTATDIGMLTVFGSLQQHKTGVGTDCNICHTVHDNANGKFLGIEKTQSAATESATYCETCHDATMYEGAGPHGDHLAGSEHPYKDTGVFLDESCNSCHQMHGAVNYTVGSLTNPILKVANTDSAYCATCHADHVQETTTGDNKHPANLSSGGSWGKISCDACHDVHQPNDSGRAAILNGANVDSAYCVTCHKATEETFGPAIGAHSHPIGESFATVGLTPSANSIDDDGDGADYPGNSASIVCESCHSAHLQGAVEPLLRITAEAGSLCVNCHSGK